MTENNGKQAIVKEKIAKIEKLNEKSANKMLKIDEKAKRKKHLVKRLKKGEKAIKISKK